MGKYEFEFETIRPIYDRLQIRKAKAPDTSAGGIVIPGQAQKEMLLALVVAVGEGRNFDGPGSVRITRAEGAMFVEETRTFLKKPCMVKEGDWVLIGKYSGHDIQIDPSKPVTTILREDEILAIVTFPAGVAVPQLEGDPDPVEEPVDLDQYRTTAGVDPGKEE